MKKQFTLALIALLLAVVGCGPTGPVEIEGTDWCYIYDFRVDDNGFNITNGSFEDGLGLLTDGGGNLIFSHVHDRFVEAAFIIVTVKRPAGITGDIAVTAAGDIFGVSAGFTAAMPAAISTYPLVFQPGTIGISGTSINVTAQADQDLLLQSIEVRGFGGSPSGANFCSDANELTPGTDTATPELTYTSTTTSTVTLTRTVTPTYTPSPTTQPDWTCTFDFTIDEQDWYTIGSADDAVYSAGLGWGGSSDTVFAGRGHIYFDFLSPDNATIYTVELTRSEILGGDLHRLDVGGWNGIVASDIVSIAQTSLTEHFEINAVLSGLVFAQYHTQFTNDPLNGYLTGAVVTGAGSIPFDPIYCNDLPTPTPTITPTTGTATPTPSPTPTTIGDWVCSYNFNLNNGGWSSAFNAQWGLDVDDNGAWRARTTSPANSLGIRFIAGGLMPLNSIRIRGRTFGTRTDDEHELNFRTYNTSWSGYSEDSHDNTLFDQTYTFATVRQSRRIEVFLSVSQTAVTATRIDLIELRGSGGNNPCLPAGTPTATVQPTTTPNGTLTVTLTGLPLVTSTPGFPTRTAIVIPTFNNITLVPGTPGTGTPPTATEGTPSTALPPEIIGDESGEIIGFSWQIGWGLFRTLFAWLQQVTDQISGILTAFFNTPPQAIPGLPLCMTNPTAHDICAIYYIMDWTVFAPNTPGALIIPLILLVMNFFIVVKFVRWVLRLVRRGENVTTVQ